MARGPGKGVTNNPNGRPPGPNKITKDMRESITLMLENHFPKLNKVLDQLEKDNPVAYANLIEKFMAYVIPKKKDITSDDQSIVPNVTIIEHRNNT